MASGLRLTGSAAQAAQDLLSRAESFDERYMPSAPINPANIPIGDPTAMLGAQATYGQVAFSKWQSCTQVGLGGIGLNTGLFDLKSLQNLTSAVQIAPEDFVSVDIQKVSGMLGGGLRMGADQAVDELVEMGMQVATDAIGAVPVIGWVVGAIVKIFTFAAKIRKWGQDRPTIYQNVRFDPDVDNSEYYAKALRSVKTGDWTAMFRPPLDSNYSGGGSWQIFHEQDGTVRIGGKLGGSAGGVAGDEQRGGVIPGSCNVHRQSDLLPNKNVIDTGQLLPGLEKQALWIWSGYASPAGVDGKAAVQPSLFAVNARTLENDWESYLGFFRGFLEYERHKIPERARIIEFYADKAYFGWPKGTVGTNDAWIGNTIPVLAAKTLRKQQEDALRNTLSCAYLTGAEPALKLDQSGLLDLLVKQRESLLHSQSRFGVDLDMVPPGAYRNALIQSGVGSGPIGVMISAAPRSAVPGAGAPTSAGPGASISFPGSGRTASKGKTAMRYLLFTGAISGAAYLAWKKRHAFMP